jgi:hypothetical protein
MERHVGASGHPQNRPAAAIDVRCSQSNRNEVGRATLLKPDDGKIDYADANARKA